MESHGLGHLAPGCWDMLDRVGGEEDERGLAIHVAEPVQPNVGAELRFALARALEQHHGDQRRAMELARSARATLGKAGAEVAELRAEVDRWLEAHGGADR